MDRFGIILIMLLCLGCAKHSDFEVDGIAFIFEPDRPDLKTEEMRARLGAMIAEGRKVWHTDLHTLRTYYWIIYTDKVKVRHCWVGIVCLDDVSGWYDYAQASIGLAFPDPDCPERMSVIHEMGHDHYFNLNNIKDMGDTDHSLNLWLPALITQLKSIADNCRSAPTIWRDP
jgi:hypothetical protein